MRPLRLYAPALDLMAKAEGVITADWIQHGARLSKRQARNAIIMGARKGLIERTGYGQYRRSPQPAGVA